MKPPQFLQTFQNKLTSLESGLAYFLAMVTSKKGKYNRAHRFYIYKLLYFQELFELSWIKLVLICTKHTILVRSIKIYHNSFIFCLKPASPLTAAAQEWAFSTQYCAKLQLLPSNISFHTN